MDRTQFLLGLSFALFTLGLVGVMVRRNALVMLMCMELMLNAVILALVTFSLRTATLCGSRARVPDLRRRGGGDLDRDPDRAAPVAAAALARRPGLRQPQGMNRPR